MATASFEISKVSSLVNVLINLAGLPPHSSPDGILLPGGTTEPASSIDRVSTNEPSISIECCPMMHSGSMVHDLRRLYAPTVTYLSINVSAGNPEKLPQPQNQIMNHNYQKPELQNKGKDFIVYNGDTEPKHALPLDK